MSEQVYISEAHLKGYKSIIDAKVQFKPGLNIIIGKNGSGKTNLVDYFKYLLDFDLSSFIEIESEIELSQKEEKYILSYKKYIEQDKIDDLISFKQDIKINNESAERNEHTKLREIDIDFLLLIIKYRIPNSIPILSKPLQIEDKFENKFFSEEVTSIIKTNSQFFFSNSLLSLLTFRSPNVKYKDKITNVIEKYRSDLENLAKKFTPIKKIRINPNFFIAISDEKLDIKDFSFEYYANDVWNKFENLSDGTQRLLFIISEIGINTTSNWGKDFVSITSKITDKIIFLEEPELGIHPHQLHLLMNFIKEESEEKQIIITTHSPQVLNVLSIDELDRILICEWTPDKGTQLRKMTEDEIEKAKVYINEVGFLSDYWLHSDFNRL